jgi:hypothetical protein
MRLLISFTVLLSTIVLAVCCMEPEQIKQPEVVYLNQGWSDEDRSTFYWAPQGSALISYDIYMSLIDPETQLPINAPELTSRFGFLQEKKGNVKNPDEFPIGVSRSIVKEGPFKGDYIGLTCAACHTNQINYNNLSIRIDGGNSTSIQLVPWMKTLKRAVEHVKSDTAAFHVLLQIFGKKQQLKRMIFEAVSMRKQKFLKIGLSTVSNRIYPTDRDGLMLSQAYPMYLSLCTAVSKKIIPMQMPP